MISCLSACAESGETGLLQLADCPQQLLSIGEVPMSPGQGPKWQAAGVSPVDQSLFSTLSSPVHTSSQARHVYTDLRLYTAPSLASTSFIPTWSEGPAPCQALVLSNLLLHEDGDRSCGLKCIACVWVSIEGTLLKERLFLLYISDLRVISFDSS